MKRNVAIFALFGIMVAALVIAVMYGRTQARTVQRLAKSQRDVCTRLEWDLEAIVRSPNSRPELHARMAYHHLDQGLMQLCFDKPIVVDAKQADWCWILKGEEDCFLDVAKQLLDAYRRRSASQRAPT